MSRIFKPSSYVSLEEIKLIETVKTLRGPLAPYGEMEGEPPFPAGEKSNHAEDDADLKEKVLKEAEDAAQELLKKAEAEAEALRKQAREEIESWWNERRARDEELASEARRKGYEEGFQEGRAQAEAKILEEFRAQVELAREIIEQAVSVKEQIIQEAEPFLVNLSIAVAEKVIRRELKEHPEWMLDLIRQHLSRKRNKGTLSICVSPERFSFVSNAREELALLIDPEAELLIVPDAQVKDDGCIIRSSLGSVDARIDTQLSEIRQALLQIAYSQGESETDD